MLALGLALATARAEDKPAAPVVPEASLSSAKKDFDTIKATREAALQAKGDAPRTAPTTGLEAETPSPSNAALRALKEKELERKKKSNWLLEAMEKDRKSEGETARPTDLEQLRALFGERSPEATATNSAQAPRGDDKIKDKAAPQVVNPLTRFMSDWMTPKDYALLQTTPGVAPTKDTLTAPVTAAPVADISGLATPLTGPSTGGGLDAALGLMAGNRAPPAPPTTRDNPFLQALPPIPAGNPAPTSFSSSILAPLPPMSGNAPPSSGFQPPPPLPDLGPAKSTIPDFAKPTFDDKAFKPMKRF